MSVTTHHRRLALWAIAWVLVLKAAVPLLASLAAGQQGRSVAEVCDVYGVKLASAAAPALAQAAHAGHAGHTEHAGHATPSDDAAAPDGMAVATADEAGKPAHGPAHGTAHTGDHCALSALTAFASQALATLPLATAEARTGVALPASTPARDATADWVARLKHGPPQAT